ncbi:acyl transferase/acyl hydrolase/lysophospholipase [Flagelloscypha sp. PMI_526]|nr:acyl transferase/acyl hydrolase/lysophospholipase [Flagelloscypha sp. PMI_526]
MSAPIVALSLDGGGFLALSELYMLKEILERLQTELNLDSAPLPCEVFDVIGGSGSGGIIAILLGRLHLDVNRAIDLFIQFYRSVYGQHPSQSKNRRLKVVSRSLQDLLKSVPGISIDDHLLETAPKCHTFVCASPTVVANGKPVCFRNFLPRKFRTFDCTILEAAQACTTHPQLFHPIKIGPPGAPEKFSDSSAYGYSNPLEVVKEETKLLFKNIEHVYLSLGPGEAQISEWYMGSRVENTSGNGEATDERIKRQISLGTLHFRLSVQQGFQQFRRHAWTEPGIIRAHTTNYMRSAASEVYINDIINSLTQKCTPKPGAFSRDLPHLF